MVQGTFTTKLCLTQMRSITHTNLGVLEGPQATLWFRIRQASAPRSVVTFRVRTCIVFLKDNHGTLTRSPLRNQHIQGRQEYMHPKVFQDKFWLSNRPRLTASYFAVHHDGVTSIVFDSCAFYTLRVRVISVRVRDTIRVKIRVRIKIE
jgi:hypothetical protein